MTVKELIKFLKFSGDREVILSSDEEGNSFGGLRLLDIEGTKDGKKVILFPSGNLSFEYVYGKQDKQNIG